MGFFGGLMQGQAPLGQNIMQSILGRRQEAQRQEDLKRQTLSQLLGFASRMAPGQRGFLSQVEIPEGSPEAAVKQGLIGEQPKPEKFALSPGQTQYQEGPEGPVPIVTAPYKPEKPPRPQAPTLDKGWYAEWDEENQNYTARRAEGYDETGEPPSTDGLPDGQMWAVDPKTKRWRAVPIPGAKTILNNKDLQQSYERLWKIVQGMPEIDKASDLNGKFLMLEGILKPVLTGKEIRVGARQIAAINAFQRMIDDAVVRSDDIRMILEGMGWSERIRTKFANIKKGDILSPEITWDMYSTAVDMVNAINEVAQSKLGGYMGGLEEGGIYDPVVLDALNATMEHTLTNPASNPLKPIAKLKQAALEGDEDAIRQLRELGVFKKE